MPVVVFVQCPRRVRFWCDKFVANMIICVTDACVLFAYAVVVTCAHTSLATKIAVPCFGVKTFDQFGFVNADYYFGDNIVCVNKCIVCHYDQLTFPVPAVIVATVYEPDVAVLPVSPAPIVIVPADVR